MNHGGRFALLGTAVILLLVGIVCLRQRGPANASPAFVPGQDSSATGRAKAVNRQPTILSADPNSESGIPNHSWRDPAVPVPELDHSLGPKYPIHAVPPVEPARLPSLGPSLESGLRAIPQPISPSELSVPSAALEPDSQPVGDLSAAEGSSTERLRPLTVLTRQNDSFWHISERAYGLGLYYQALFAFNRDRLARPDRIAAGVELVIPPIDELRRLFPDLCPSGG